VETNQNNLALMLESILDTAVDGIITIDNKGSILSINQAALALFEYKKDEVLGENVRILMGEHDARHHDTYINNYITTRKPKIIGIGREVYGKKASGATFPFRLGVSEVILNDRIIFTGIVHDLTVVKNTLEELRLLNEELDKKVKERTEEIESVVNKLLATNAELKNQIKTNNIIYDQLREKEHALEEALLAEKKLNDLKSKFVSTASHEFRTPLSAILSSASLIGKYNEHVEIELRQKHVEKIKKSVVYLTGILNDFLSLSKIEEGKITIILSEVNTELLFQEIEEELSSLLKNQKRIQWHIDSQSQNINTDKKILKSILFNLISNALKYSDQMVDIHVEQFTNHIEIKITDHGIGIPEEEQPFLFERFYRAKNVENIQGTGLGLNIVKKYCDMLGYTISYLSKENIGSTFTIEIPF
jgi:two-component system, LuxR family, sensor kinase FixL